MSELDVYFSDPDTCSDAYLAAAYAVLSAPERERAARFRFERDRRLYVVTHAMLRRALAERLQEDPSRLEFDHNAYGRPELASPHARRIRFSLSHSHGMAVCALTPERDIGVDVEPLGRELPLAVAERYFAPFELEDVLGLPTEEQAARFFAYWTLKEAYVKARGIGLSLPVARIAFVLSDTHVEFTPDAQVEPEPKDWTFHSFRIGSTHQAALALRGSQPFSMNARQLP